MKKTKKRQIKRPTIIAPYMIGLLFIVFFSIFHLANLGRTFLSRQTQAQAEDLIAPTPASKYTYKSCTESKKISASTFDKELKPEVIKIDQAGIHLNIVSVPLQKGTWKVYPKVANYAEGTSLINSKTGNVGIFAHDRADGFAKIKDLKDGDIIEVFSAGHLIKYRVQLARVVEPTDVDVFFATENPTLTLVTCDGNFSQQRYVVRAELQEIEELNCNEKN